MRARGQEWERNSREAGRAEQVMLDYDGPQHPCGLSFSGKFYFIVFFSIFPDRRACDRMFVCLPSSCQNHKRIQRSGRCIR